MALSLGVVVCTYRRPNHLQRCLESLMSQDYSHLRVVVVGVEGDMPSFRVADEYGVQMVSQVAPQGIPSARNLGIDSIRTDLVAFIDDDARARPNWIDALAQAFSSPAVGAVGGPVIDARLGRQVVHPWVVDHLGVTHRSTEAPEVPGGIPTLNGCNMAFSRRVLNRVGGFDPYYRYYFDETDLCVRVARAGYEIRYTDLAVVEHDFADGPTRERFLYFSSRMRAYFSVKNFRGKVPSGRLLLGQGITLQEDLRAYRRLRPRYPGLSGGLRAIQELAIGRFEGVVDGSLASQSQVARVQRRDDSWYS